MKRILGAALLIASLAFTGCKKEEGGDAPKADDKGGQAPQAGKTTDPGKDKPADPGQDKPPEEAKKTDTPETKLARYKECWDAMTGGNADAFRGCLADNVVSTMVDSVPEMKFEGPDKIVEMMAQWKTAFPDMKSTPQLIMASGDTILAIHHSTGTNSGEMMGMPATNKKVGTFEAQLVVMGNDGKITEDRWYSDQSTMLHQLGVVKNPMSPDPIAQGWGETKEVIAKDDDAEKANVDQITKALDALNKKDVKAYEALLADDVKFYYHGDKNKVEDKKAYSKGLKEHLAMSKDMKSEVKNVFAAGDWVAIETASSGSLAKDLPGFKGTKGKKHSSSDLHFFQLADGKVKQHHIFANSLKMMVDLGVVKPEDLMKGAGKEGGGEGAAAGEGGEGGAQPAEGAKKEAGKDAKKKKASKDEEEGGW